MIYPKIINDNTRTTEKKKKKAKTNIKHHEPNNCFTLPQCHISYRLIDDLQLHSCSCMHALFLMHNAKTDNTSTLKCTRYATSVSSTDITVNTTDIAVRPPKKVKP